MAAHLDADTMAIDRPAPPRRRRRIAPSQPIPRAPSEPRAKDDEARAQAEALYGAAARAAGGAAAEALQLEAWRVGARVRDAWEVGGGFAAAQTADRWLAHRFGSCDDELRRALVASLAFVLVPEGVPEALRMLYPAAHLRLARYLDSGAPYDPDFFAKDLAFGCGLFAPIGPLSLGLPTSKAFAARLAHTKKAAGLLVRTATAGRVAATAELASAAGVRPWAELHVDTRNLREFHAEGFLRMYHRLAALLRLRPDLAGVHGASWLYDPAVGVISPSLDFTAEPIRSGGAVLVRLGVDPVQTAYAVSRSPTRRQLWLEGRYQPTCYGMYWPRGRLLAWCAARR